MPGYGFGRCAAHGDESIRAVRRAVRDGYRHTGSAAKPKPGKPRDCGVPRAELSVSSKIRPTPFGDPDAARAKSLSNLRPNAPDSDEDLGGDPRTFTEIRPHNPQRREP